MISELALALDRLSGGRLERSRLLRELYYRYSEWTQSSEHRSFRLETHEVDGFRIRIDPSKEHQRAILAGHDDAAKAWVRDRLRDRDRTVAYDVGANVGSWTLFLAAYLPDPTVVAVEPEPLTMRQLRTNIAINGFEDRVVPVEAVLSDRSGLADLHVSRSRNQGAHGLAPTGHHGDATVSVPSTPGDALVARHGPPDLLKVDVEGAEAKVLAGFGRTIRNHAPVMVVDLHARELDRLSSVDEIRATIDRLAENGTVHAVRGGTVEPIPPGRIRRPDTLLVAPDRESK